ncbi:MAG: YqzL family protein [Niameybacter sp.]
MLNHLWKCFETTGDIATYLEFKEYEKTRESLAEKRVDET